MIEYYLKKSLIEHRTVSIIYRSNNGITQRDIRIIKINGEKVFAHCYLRNETRVFKIANILGASLKSEYVH